MPFTPTHILAIVPVAALLPRLPRSALLIGSVIPDLPLFVAWVPAYGTTHSFPGILTACLPLGLVAFTLFHYLLKTPLLAVLPEEIRKKLVMRSLPPPSRSLSFWSKVCPGISIGASTHVVWDAFTHERRWGVELFPVLQSSIPILGDLLPLYKIVQYGSTLIGLPVVGFLTAFWFRKEEPRPAERLLPRHIKAVVLTFLCAIPCASAVTAFLATPASTYVRTGHAVIAFGQSFLLTLIVYSVSYLLLTRHPLAVYREERHRPLDNLSAVSDNEGDV